MVDLGDASVEPAANMAGAVRRVRGMSIPQSACRRMAFRDRWEVPRGLRSHEAARQPPPEFYS